MEHIHNTKDQLKGSAEISSIKRAVKAKSPPRSSDSDWSDIDTEDEVNKNEIESDDLDVSDRLQIDISQEQNQKKNLGEVELNEINDASTSKSVSRETPPRGLPSPTKGTRQQEPKRWQTPSIRSNTKSPLFNS
jgi:hypothetical protein